MASSRRRLATIAASVVGAAVLAAGGVAFGLTTMRTVTGPGGDRAVAAALAHVGGGVAQGVEYEDDAGVSWEVEVVTRDGRRLEVLVGHRFAVVRVESEDEDSGRADDD